MKHQQKPTKFQKHQQPTKMQQKPLKTSKMQQKPPKNQPKCSKNHQKRIKLHLKPPKTNQNEAKTTKHQPKGTGGKAAYWNCSAAGGAEKKRGKTVILDFRGLIALLDMLYPTISFHWQQYLWKLCRNVQYAHMCCLRNIFMKIRVLPDTSWETYGAVREITLWISWFPPLKFKKIKDMKKTGKSKKSAEYAFRNRKFPYEFSLKIMKTYIFSWCVMIVMLFHDFSWLFTVFHGALSRFTGSNTCETTGNVQKLHMCWYIEEDVSPPILFYFIEKSASSRTTLSWETYGALWGAANFHGFW